MRLVHLLVVMSVGAGVPGCVGAPCFFREGEVEVSVVDDVSGVPISEPPTFSVNDTLLASHCTDGADAATTACGRYRLSSSSGTGISFVGSNTITIAAPGYASSSIVVNTGSGHNACGNTGSTHNVTTTARLTPAP